GWYEWCESEPVRSESGRTVRQPYFISDPAQEVIAFAGLWSVWERPGASPIISCALLSREAAPSIAAIHHRMPVVLRPEHYAAWLSSSTSAQEVEAMIANCEQHFEGYRVSTKVNNVRNDSEELLERVDADITF
ncbi:MAG: SOS response-associated peptidase family protein, partial [Actinomycetota bacterium]|nr:SOS response-associated peptidase family protein [Actinomycetota bacterium]